MNTLISISLFSDDNHKNIQHPYVCFDYLILRVYGEVLKPYCKGNRRKNWEILIKGRENYPQILESSFWQFMFNKTQVFQKSIESSIYTDGSFLKLYFEVILELQKCYKGYAEKSCRILFIQFHVILTSYITVIQKKKNSN